MAQWKFEHGRAVCGACERTFEEGERHASTLLIREEELKREDLCTTCWPKHQDESEGDPARVDVFWWFTRHAKDKKRTLQLDLGSLERLFVELEGREETRVRELRYVLCLLLMRKRRLKVERIERSEEGESFVVKRPRREERFSVFVFDFTPDRMDAVRQELMALLDGAPEDAPEDAPEEEEEGDEVTNHEGPAKALSE